MHHPFKKVIYSVCIIITINIFFILFGCNKSFINEEPIPNKNTALTLHISDIMDVRATDVYTKPYALKRRIEIIDRRNNLIHDTFFILLISKENNCNIYTQLKNKVFSGTLSIISDDEILYIKQYNKGATVIAELDQMNRRKVDIVPTCKITVIHNCVAQKINNMSIFEYGMCLATAPACYAQLWGACGFLDCITGEQNRENI